MNMTTDLCQGEWESGPQNCPLSASAFVGSAQQSLFSWYAGSCVAAHPPVLSTERLHPSSRTGDRQETVTAQEEEVGCRDQASLNLSRAPGLGVRLCAQPLRGEELGWRRQESQQHRSTQAPGQPLCPLTTTCGSSAPACPPPGEGANEEENVQSSQEVGSQPGSWEFSDSREVDADREVPAL